MTHSRNVQRWWTLLLLCGAAGASPAALVHSLHVMQGELVVHPDRVVMTIEGDGRSLAHWIGAADESLAGDALRDVGAEQMEALARGVLVRDGEGERLQVSGIRLELPEAEGEAGDDQRFSYTLEFRGGEDRSVLVLQYTPVRPSLHREKIVLLVCGAGQKRRQLIQLTSGGNVEYLDVQLADERGSFAAAGEEGATERVRVRVASRFSRPTVELTADESQLAARVCLPLNMLGFWLSLEMQTPGVLSASERQASLPEMRALFGRAMAVERGEATVWPRVASLEFNSAKGPAATSDALCVWTGQVVATLQWPDSAASDSAVAWRLFNQALMSIDVDAAGGQVRRRLTSYSPRIFLREARAR